MGESGGHMLSEISWSQKDRRFMIPLIGDIKVVKEEGSEGRGYVCVCVCVCIYSSVWFPLLYRRNQHIVKQLSSNLKKKF